MEEIKPDNKKSADSAPETQSLPDYFKILEEQLELLARVSKWCEDCTQTVAAIPGLSQAMIEIVRFLSQHD